MQRALDHCHGVSPAKSCRWVAVFAGLTLGSALAVAAARSLAAAWWARPLLFGVTWLDRRTWSLILLVLGAACLVACLIPVRRALAVDPIRVLRDQ